MLTWACETVEHDFSIFTHGMRAPSVFTKKQEKPNEPECSHVKHFCETHIFQQSCTFSHFSLVTVQALCRLRNMERGGVQSVEYEESGVLSGECSV